MVMLRGKIVNELGPSKARSFSLWFNFELGLGWLSGFSVKKAVDFVSYRLPCSLCGYDIVVELNFSSVISECSMHPFSDE